MMIYAIQLTMACHGTFLEVRQHLSSSCGVHQVTMGFDPNMHGLDGEESHTITLLHTWKSAFFRLQEF